MASSLAQAVRDLDTVQGAVSNRLDLVANRLDQAQLALERTSRSLDPLMSGLADMCLQLGNARQVGTTLTEATAHLTTLSTETRASVESGTASARAAFTGPMVGLEDDHQKVNKLVAGQLSDTTTFIRQQSTSLSDVIQVLGPLLRRSADEVESCTDVASKSLRQMQDRLPALLVTLTAVETFAQAVQKWLVDRKSELGDYIEDATPLRLRSLALTGVFGETIGKSVNDVMDQAVQTVDGQITGNVRNIVNNFIDNGVGRIKQAVSAAVGGSNEIEQKFVQIPAVIMQALDDIKSLIDDVAAILKKLGHRLVQNLENLADKLIDKITGAFHIDVPGWAKELGVTKYWNSFIDSVGGALKSYVHVQLDRLMEVGDVLIDFLRLEMNPTNTKAYEDLGRDVWAFAKDQARNLVPDVGFSISIPDGLDWDGDVTYKTWSGNVRDWVKLE